MSSEQYVRRAIFTAELLSMDSTFIEGCCRRAGLHWWWDLSADAPAETITGLGRGDLSLRAHTPSIILCVKTWRILGPQRRGYFLHTPAI
jgi:hypothetical protein